MNELATYNLGTVLRETGINADTLRAWERRYNLPSPERSEGGHRLYSQRDMAIIKWLLLQQDAGMRIGQAVKLWRRKLEFGEDPLSERDANFSGADETLLEQSQLGNFQQNWIKACVAFDEQAAEQIASEAFAHFSLETVFMDILLPGIREIGDLWYQGAVTVQQEHFASALLTRRLNALIATSPAPTRPEKIIIGCPPQEEHTLSLLLLNLFLRRRGFHILYLGTNIPLEEFKETVEAIQPQLIIFAAQLLTTAATLEQTIRALADNHVPIAYSGRIFNSTPSIKKYIDGHFLGQSFPEVFKNIEKILQIDTVPALDFPETSYQDIYTLFGFYRSALEAHLTQELSTWDMPLKPLIDATESLNEKVTAALYLGDLDLLLPELTWVKHLLEHRRVEAVRLDRYLETYTQAVVKVMGEDALLLTRWMQTQIASYQQVSA